MIYQDQWQKGQLLIHGYRECEARYSIIKDYCKDRLPRGFSVCDIGANMCYFGIRLAEDFDCAVMAFEFHNFITRKAHVITSGVKENILLFNHHISVYDIRKLNRMAHFGLVLCLSVLHHVRESQSEWEHALARLGDISIVEYAGSDSKRERANIDFDPNDKGLVIGYGDSHLDKSKKRPIVVLRKDL